MSDPIIFTGDGPFHLQVAQQARVRQDGETVRFTFWTVNPATGKLVEISIAVAADAAATLSDNLSQAVVQALSARRGS